MINGVGKLDRCVRKYFQMTAEVLRCLSKVTNLPLAGKPRNILDFNYRPTLRERRTWAEDFHIRNPKSAASCSWYDLSTGTAIDRDSRRVRDGILCATSRKRCRSSPWGTKLQQAKQLVDSHRFLFRQKLIQQFK
jgi:hypothetical protein